MDAVATDIVRVGLKSLELSCGGSPILSGRADLDVFVSSSQGCTKIEVAVPHGLRMSTSKFQYLILMDTLDGNINAGALLDINIHVHANQHRHAI